MRATVTLKTWPGTGAYRPPQPMPDKLERLADRTALIMHAFSLPGVEELGIGAWRVVFREAVLDAGIFYDDGLSTSEVEALEAWAGEHPVATPAGARPLRVLSKSAFLDDREKDREEGVFVRNAYWGRAWVVGFDLGRTLGLFADRWTAASKGRWAGGWVLHFGPWEREVTASDGKQRFQLRSRRPSLRVMPLATRGVKVEFGPAPRYAGHPTSVLVPGSDGRPVPYRGRFLDLLPASFSLDGIDDDDLARHLAGWGLEPLPGGPHYCALPTPEGAELVTAMVERLHQLALRVDRESSAWGLDLPRLASPGTAAGQLVQRLGVVPPLARLDVDEGSRAVLLRLAWRQGAREAEAAAWADEVLSPARWGMGAWRAASLGGLVEARSGFTGRLFKGLDVDLRSAYPALAHLLGWWAALTAEDLEPADVTADFRAFLAEPGLAETVKDPRTWRRWGLTRCHVRSTGQPLPVHLSEADRTAVLPVLGEGDWAWPDVVRAALDGSAPEVLEAVRLRPVGRQGGLRSAATPAGRLGPDDDPVLTLHAFRDEAKTQGDWRLSGWLRVVLNALTYGNAGRFDSLWGGREKPGPWCFPPLATTIAAGCRLLLGLLETDVKAAGGEVAYFDTDGAIVAGLDRATLDELLVSFDALCPWGGHFWSVEAEGEAFVFAPKRYVFLGGPHTEHSIGALVPPPPMAGQDPASGHHAWLAEAAEALARGKGEDGLRPAFSWEGAAPDFPVLRRSTVSSSAQAARLPRAWHVRPFPRYVSPICLNGQYPVALDPGGDLAGWDELAWWDGASGEPVAVSTDPEVAFGYRAAWLETLAEYAVEWGEATEADELPREVHLDQRLVRLEGRSAGRFATWGVDFVYGEPDQAAVVREALRALGTERFAELTGLSPAEARLLRKRARFGPGTRALLTKALGPDPLARLLDFVDDHARLCALDGCDHRVRNVKARFCGCSNHPSHEHRAKMRRLRAGKRTPDKESA